MLGELLWTSISSEHKKPLQLHLYRPSQNQQELSIFILPASRHESQILIFIFHNFFFMKQLRYCVKPIVSYRMASPSFTYTLFHLSAHVVNRLLRENWNNIPNFLSGKNF